jgi:hypothetical protein
MNYMMLNWTQASVSGEYMLVARNVAVQMCTGCIEAEEVTFTHEFCEGKLARQHSGVLGATAGTFFFVDFGQHNDKPHQATFFVPRHALALPHDDDIITVQTHDAHTGEPVGYPGDVDVAAVNHGKLRVR